MITHTNDNWHNFLKSCRVVCSVWISKYDPRNYPYHAFDKLDFGTFRMLCKPSLVWFIGA